ncbi:hypothetical protein BUE80_DR011691 [Diplocarpon rosae]|nr:hypothetical protein BUE80_DR011691 [Diplocarpon rosae]
MSLVSQHLSTHNNNSLLASNEVTDPDSNNLFTEAALSRLLGVSANPSRQSMDRGAHEYSQSGLQSPSHAFKDSPSEETTADHASAAHYAPPPEARANHHNHSSSATPTSEYGIYPASARSSSFPGHVQRPYHPSSNGGAPGAMYSQPRPDWAGYAGGQHPMHGGYPVYSFVPIPGAQQHKRPRRRYEEIERMYKCGWNGCEKAYGTLNHLNAHSTEASMGRPQRRDSLCNTTLTPLRRIEFKEIRKEWKARKKEEETQRKAEDDRARAAVVPADGQAPSDNAAPAGYQQPGRSVQLPPIGYQPGAQVPGQYQAAPPAGVQQLQDYPNSHLQYSGYPASPYGAPNQMYNQRHYTPSSSPRGKRDSG